MLGGRLAGESACPTRTDIVEGPPGRPLMRGVEDAGLVVEACFSAGVSSGEAGAILQKLRTYRIRVAVVCPPGSVRFSSRFNEMTAEESGGEHFRLFESVPAAREWLRRSGIHDHKL